MEREPPKSSHKMEMELDRISDLPEHIIEQILSHWRILDAASKDMYLVKQVEYTSFDYVKEGSSMALYA
ncbi:hypothetical protein TIFTF001_005296 [Ficus carica]|uniref:Uncharacterized protein n=1 Tax=Ficus carica TaxID=3494 RepID=A0AA87ZXR9_FICCA|nr:hypothetical protein TIFTF001_005296 [Ficus carica]